MNDIACDICVSLMKKVYRPINNLKLKNKITFISRQSDIISDDFSVISDTLKKKDPNIEIIILTKKLDRSLSHRLSYPFHMLKQMYHLSTSKVVILDGYCIVASVLPHKKGTTLIQMWHSAGAIKKFGWQTIGKPSGTTESIAQKMHMHDKYDIVIAPSRRTSEFYSEGFNTELNKFKIICPPHIEKLFKGSRDISNVLRKKYNIPNSKSIILYAPTFRKGKSIQCAELAKKLDPEKYILVYKPHPLDDVSELPRNAITESDDTTYDWLIASDIIISDYSALVLESALLNKKLFLYLYDESEYKKDPGLNIIPENEAIKNMIFRNADELEYLLKKPYDYNSLKVFSEKYFECDPENSVESYIKLIEEAINNEC